MSNYVNKVKKDGVVYDIHDKRIDDAQEGTLDKVLGFDSEGGLVKGSVSGGTKLYKHNITCVKQGDTIAGHYLSTSSQPVTLDNIDNSIVVIDVGSISNITKPFPAATFISITLTKTAYVTDNNSNTVEAKIVSYNTINISDILSFSDTVTAL